MADDLLVRAAIRDELSGPLEEIRRELRGAGEAAQDAGRKANRGARGFDAMAGGVGRLAKRAAGLALKGAVVGTAALGAAAGVAAVKLVGLASTAEETANVFTTVLGKGSPAEKAATQFVTQLGKSSGIATQELQQAVGSFAVLGKQAGKTGPELASFATDLTQAGLDLGSFYNKSPEEVFGAIQSGLTGEAEALKQLNIFMTEAALNTYALEQGIGKTTQQMTEQEKIALRQGFIMSQLGDANGDLARTSDGFANRLRYLQGRMKEAGTVIGAFLLPYANALVTALGDKVGGAVDKLDTVLPALEENLTKVGGAFEYLRNRFEDGGIDAVVKSLDNMTGSGGKLEGAFATAKGIVDDLGAVLNDVLLPVIERVTSAIDPSWLTPLGLARVALGLVADHGALVADVLTLVVLGLTAAKVITTVLAVKTAILTGFWWALNAAMAANPITLIVLALAALVAGLVLAWRHSETFREIVFAVFRTVGKAILSYVDGWLMAIETVAGVAAKIPGPIGDAARSIQEGIGKVRGKVAGLKLDLDNLGRTKASPTVQLLGVGAFEENLARLERRVTNIGGVQVRIPVRAGGGGSTSGRAGGVQGDTATSRAGAGGLANTFAAHARYAGAGVKVSNILTGGGGKGHGSGDHQAGRALDLVGNGLGRYAERVRADGGYAAMHGAGSSRHLHAVPAGDTSRSMVRRGASSTSSTSSSSSAPSVVIGAGAIVVSGLTQDEAARAVATGIRDYVRNQQERA